MDKLNVLLEKSKFTIENEGFAVFTKRTREYLERQISKKSNDFPDKTFMDVLFINGCYLPHPSRYRITHQKEQLYANNMATNEIFYDDINLDLVKNYRVFIFFRCPITEKIEKFIKLAKEMNKVVLFDIDDLVIDRKYTDQIKYLNTMTKEEKANYDEGVARIQKTLRLCDAAITTTEGLAEELKNYVPEVFINRNTASERMVELSEQEIYERDVLPYKELIKVENKKLQKDYNLAVKKSIERKKGGIRLGYFSGSITHNDDIKMILPALSKLMTEYKNLELHVVGELEVPNELKAFQERIITRKFVSWEKLPKLIASVDINLAPLEKNIFNEAKSENKWVEAALVKVPTVASNIGAFKKMITNGETGLLCDTVEEWYKAIKFLIEDESARKKIAEISYQYANKRCTTVYTGYPLYKYIRNKMKPNIAFVLPTLHISGGVLVAFKHCIMLKEAGYDILLINDGYDQNNIVYNGLELPVISRKSIQIHGTFDKAVATLWTTTSFIVLYPNILNRYYFVQNFETDFYESGHFFKIAANQTYNLNIPLKYITISKWCQNWLKDNYEKNAQYAPNGLDVGLFYPRKREFEGKIRILVEGNSDDFYKNVDESFKIIEKLDKNKFEIWFMSYQGKPKKGYYVDKFLHKVPHEKVAEIYRECHILIKSSILESFSYPPLEMMATGGYVVVAPNGGNVEYLEDEGNCLFYEPGNIDSAVEAISKICNDEGLRAKLYEGGIKTANSRSWDNIKHQILKLYDID